MSVVTGVRPFLRPARSAASRAGRRGFTMIELVLVVVLVGILSAIALPRFAEMTARRRMDAAVRRLQADFALAQRHARLTVTSCTVQMNSAQHTLQIVGLKDPDIPTRDYIVDLTRPPYEVRLMSVDLGGNENVVFDGYGRPDSNGSIRLRASNYRIELLLDANNGVLTRGSEW